MYWQSLKPHFPNKKSNLSPFPNGWQNWYCPKYSGSKLKWHEFPWKCGGRSIWDLKRLNMVLFVGDNASDAYLLLFAFQDLSSIQIGSKVFFSGFLPLWWTIIGQWRKLRVLFIDLKAALLNVAELVWPVAILSFFVACILADRHVHISSIVFTELVGVSGKCRLVHWLLTCEDKAKCAVTKNVEWKERMLAKTYHIAPLDALAWVANNCNVYCKVCSLLWRLAWSRRGIEAGLKWMGW